MKKILTVFTLVVMLSLFVNAHGGETFTEAEGIIKSKIDCDELSDYQLEILGDYYMEQMHPGETHEIMDERMGGEGSESLRQIHINMGKSFYCGDHEAMNGGMMDMIIDRNNEGNMMNYGMMGNFSPFGMFWGGYFGFFYMIIFWGLLIWFIVWLVLKLSERGNKK